MKVQMLGRTSKEEIEERIKIVATAGALSRNKGTVTKVYESRNDYEKNLKLIKNILDSGHGTISEHDCIRGCYSNC